MRDRRGLEENFPHKSGPLLWASPGAAKALHQQYPLRENIKRTEACARGCEYIYNEWRPGLGAWRATPLVNISCLRPQPLLLINLITLDPVIRTLCKIQTYLYWNAYAILYVSISELGNVHIQTPQTNKEKIYNFYSYHFSHEKIYIQHTKEVTIFGLTRYDFDTRPSVASFPKKCLPHVSYFPPFPKVLISTAFSF